MKISIFLPDLSVDGTGRAALNLANGLMKFGYDVELVVLNTHGGFETKSFAFKIVDMGISRQRYSFFALAIYLKKRRPDVAISVIMNLPLMVAKFIGNNQKTKIILSLHSHYTASIAQAKSINIKISRYIENILLKFSDRIVAVSESVADSLIEATGISRNMIEVIYNPLIDENSENHAMKIVEEDWFSDDSRKKFPVILAVGRLAKEKNYPFLLRGFSLLLKEKNARLVILGEGDQRENVLLAIDELGINSQVKLLGMVENPYKYMFNSDLFVLTSNFEGLPNTVIEAMSCGLTPVVTDSPGGSAEAIGYGEYGYLTKVGDLEDLVTAMNKGLSQPIDPGRLRERAKDFSVSVSASKYSSLVKKLVRENV